MGRPAAGRKQDPRPELLTTSNTASTSYPKNEEEEKSRMVVLAVVADGGRSSSSSSSRVEEQQEKALRHAPVDSRVRAASRFHRALAHHARHLSCIRPSSSRGKARQGKARQSSVTILHIPSTPDWMMLFHPVFLRGRRAEQNGIQRVHVGR